MAGTCIISTKLLEELQARCLSLAREAAEAAIQSRRASAKAASTSAPEASQAGGGIYVSLLFLLACLHMQNLKLPKLAAALLAVTL